jgi:hypothetical protein
MYPARENILQLAKLEQGQDDFRHGEIHNDHLFVFLKQCDAPKDLQPKLRMLDGVWIIPPDQAKDVQLDKPVWTPIRSDVRFGWLDQGTCMLDDNWSKPDTDGTWSEGPKAGVVIPIRHVQFDDPNPKKVNLDLRAQSHKPVTVSVLVNGVKVSDLKLDHVRQNYTIPLPAKALRKEVMDVKFVVQDAAADKADAPAPTPAAVTGRAAAAAGSSAQAGSKKDEKAEQRMLGIKLIDMRLTTAKPAASPAANTAMKG